MANLLPLWIILGLIGGFIFIYVIPNFIIANHVYMKTCVRANQDQWGRHVSLKDDDEQVEMYKRGIEWQKPFDYIKQEITITSFDGLKLVGEFYNFNSDKTVIVVQGRTESLLYSYYFADPYQKRGYNILVIDPRVHGLSEGKYTSIGENESKDLLQWAKYIHDNFGCNNIMFHALCVGSAACIYALTSEQCPEYLTGMVADGMYQRFYDTFYNHIKDAKKPAWPCALIVMLFIKMKTGAKGLTYGPIYCIDKLAEDKFILFVNSQKDKFSTPSKTKELYEKCSSKKKELVFFPVGAHSHVRINQEKSYDEAVTNFLNKYN